jgi:hypothetical protein
MVRPYKTKGSRSIGSVKRLHQGKRVGFPKGERGRVGGFFSNNERLLSEVGILENPGNLLKTTKYSISCIKKFFNPTTCRVDQSTEQVYY